MGTFLNGEESGCYELSILQKELEVTDLSNGTTFANQLLTFTISKCSMS